jgi:hypothetical protein
VIRLLKRLFGYCDHCQRWFQFPIKRSMHTAYADHERNFIVTCGECILDINDYWDERWREYWSGCL